MSRELLRIIDRYDEAVSTMEDAAVNRLNAALDQSFRTLQGQLKGSYDAIASTNSLLPTQRKLLILQELGDTLAIVRPELAADYQQLFSELITNSHETGVSLADALSSAIAPGSPALQFSAIPIEAVALASTDSYNRLLGHGTSFAGKATAAIDQSLIQGWGATKLTGILAAELGIAKGKAESIARTETISALSNASQSRYRQRGIEYVQIYPVKDSRTCPTCLARCGYIYEVGRIMVPLHPRCRCYLVPTTQTWMDEGLTDLEFSKQYREEAIASFDGELNYGLSPFEKYSGMKEPPKAVWTP